MQPERQRLRFDIDHWLSRPQRGDCIIQRVTRSLARLVVADAAGHDDGAADMVHFIRPRVLADLSRELNERVFRAWSTMVYDRFGDDGLFVCFTVIDLDIPRRLLKIANGGNPDLLIRRASRWLDHYPSTGMPLGLTEPSSWVPPRFAYTRLYEGDYALCFSDGLIDRAGSNGDRFGLDRVCVTAKNAGPRVLRVMRRFVDLFSDKSGEHDDLSVVLLRGLEPG